MKFFLACIIEQKIDYRGNDIAHAAGILDMQTCADFCASTSGGRFWTYNTATKGCYVKTSSSGRITKETDVSGNRECASPGKRTHHVA